MADKSAMRTINRRLLVCQGSIGGWGQDTRWHLPALPTTLARQFLPVLTTTLSRLATLSQNERQLLRSQASRKEEGCPYIYTCHMNFDRVQQESRFKVQSLLKYRV
jgi:hypothetical protein